MQLWQGISYGKRFFVSFVMYSSILVYFKKDPSLKWGLFTLKKILRLAEIQLQIVCLCRFI